MKNSIISRLNNIFSKQRALIAAAAILLLPLIFIGTHTSSDWGDDLHNIFTSL